MLQAEQIPKVLLPAATWNEYKYLLYEVQLVVLDSEFALVLPRRCKMEQVTPAKFSVEDRMCYNFKTYPSIQDHTDTEFLELAKSVLGDKVCVAREMIDGANLSFVITKFEIGTARRRNLIGPLDEFFDYQNVVARYLPRLKMIQKSLEGRAIQIYGEYAIPKFSKVDYGAWDFYLFGVRTDRVWSDSDVVQFAQTYAFKMPPLLARGTLQELLQLPREFQSVVKGITEQNMYKMFEQRPPLDNTAEGFVIRPELETVFEGQDCVMVKCKSEKFKWNNLVAWGKRYEDPDILPVLTSLCKMKRVRRIFADYRHPIVKEDFYKLVSLVLEDTLEEAEYRDEIIPEVHLPEDVLYDLRKYVERKLRAQWKNLVCVTKEEAYAKKRRNPKKKSTKTCK